MKNHVIDDKVERLDKLSNLIQIKYEVIIYIK